MSYYPIPVPPHEVLESLPATIIAPRAGRVRIQHYWGNTAKPELDRLWIDLPSRHVQEVTTGDRAESWPGDIVNIEVAAGEEIRVGINGAVDTSSSGGGHTTPQKFNDGPNARVHDIHPSKGGWGHYIEWEDLVLSGTNNHFNDSRTLIFFPGGWKVGAL